MAKLFLIDDHPLVREWLGALISKESDLLVCGETDTAQGAVEAIKAAGADLAVVDLSLADASGIDLVRELQQHAPDVRILVLSMHEDPRLAEQALRSGARGYLVKRESGSRVIEASRTVLSGRIFVSESLSAALSARLCGHAMPDDPTSEFSERELEAFRMRGSGLSTKQIAEAMKISVRTVESYETRIKGKLGIHTSAELMREAVRWVDRVSGRRPT